MEQKTCDNLLEYYNGLLEGKEKDAFEKHLKQCDACQEEWAEWQDLTADLPYLSEEAQPPIGMKERILTNVTASNSSFTHQEKQSVNKTDELTTTVSPITQRKSKPWIQGLLAAGLLLSLGTNAYLFNENNKNEQVIEEQINKTFKTVQLASEETDSTGVASMVQENDTMNLVVQTNNLTQVKGTETYQVWLIEGDKPYRAGTFTPDENGNGAVVFPVKFEGEHNWDAVAISHEPTPNSKKPVGTIVMASNL
ncbi:anti-sigma factor [Fictibacillus sp. 18YEL24]|uniref:anti-sigma factor n=1 Tax=Fictibacillus sp. 18YEL24 TaxID=2745875 RepID=UPI0018CE9D44|nr:anti-sigma factor [Fictibacillus sp. 18YEL24]MBH0169828.1 anti-sigma factor [Fictibacillus sp. 18YEL24]